MKVLRCHSLGLAAVTSALTLHASEVLATTTSSSDSPTTSTSFTTENGCVPTYFGDGDCDLYNNNEDCGGYDGGDCCECTCIDSDDFVCGAGYHGGFTCIDPSAECVDDDDATINPEEESDYYLPDSYYSSYTTSLGCIPVYIADAFCDENNNNEECGFDGGDCCECTCVSTEDYTCGEHSTYDRGFACLDPSASCVDDDDFVPYSDTSSSSSSPSTSLCLSEASGDGNCDSGNNIDECGYDGGDCCECDCGSTLHFTCDDNNYDCVDPSSSCINGYILASTKTTITASANAYDTRPGEASGGVGCGEQGCAPALSLDGIIDDTESRWSCAQKIVPDGGVCVVEFTFEDPQDIVEVQVAFWKGDERSRTLEATINSEVIGEFDSYTGSIFTALGIEGVGVKTMSFTTVGLTEYDWISLIEVRFLVEP